jgi:hypothetical protein
VDRTVRIPARSRVLLDTNLRLKNRAACLEFPNIYKLAAQRGEYTPGPFEEFVHEAWNTSGTSDVNSGRYLAA